MKFYLDSANIEDINQYSKIIDLAGVTTNPSILKSEGKINFFEHLKSIMELIKGKEFHIQVVGHSAEDMIKSAHCLLEELGNEIYIKVPVTEEGLTAMKQLKSEGIKLTATAIYTQIQAALAISLGVDYIAPYYNRMLDLNIRSEEVIEALVNMTTRDGINTKVFGASFKNISQVDRTINLGVNHITLGKEIFEKAFSNKSIISAVGKFNEDFIEIFQVNTISEL